MERNFSAAAEANLQTGVLLLCKEALITAIQDSRLRRGHLRVLAEIATYINARTAKAWPNRNSIAESLGMAPESVSNRLLELRNFGYLLRTREQVPEAGGRRLSVYTFGSSIDHETIRREITVFVHKIRTQRDADEVTACGDSHSSQGVSKSLPAVTVTAHGGRKSPPAVDSNSSKEQASPIGEGAKAPMQPVRDIWRSGLDYLVSVYGEGVEADLRSRLGKMRQHAGDEAVLGALSKAQGSCVSDPLAYMQGVLRNARPGQPKATPSEQRKAFEEGQRFREKRFVDQWRG